MTDRDALLEIRRIADAAISIQPPDPVPGPIPGPTPAPVPVPVPPPPPEAVPSEYGRPDARGLVSWSRVDNDLAARFPTIPRLFHVWGGLDQIPPGKLHDHVYMSVSGAEMRQNRAMTYKPAPWWKPHLTWVEDETIMEAFASSRTPDELYPLLVARGRQIKAGMAKSWWYLRSDEALYANGLEG